MTDSVLDLQKVAGRTTANPNLANRLKTGAIVADGVEMTVAAGGQPLRILKGIDWEIQKGEIQLLMGPSGSGKTTLLSILAGLLTPTGGNVYLLGQETTQMSAATLTEFRRKHIGFIFQDFNLFPALTAQENVMTSLNLKGIQGRRAKLEAQELLDHVGLGDKAQNLPRNLSGGQKQRVAIARALAGRPEIIMADEPTASLDSKSGHAVMELLRQLAKEEGCTVLMVSHDPRIIDVADRVAHMEDGVLQEEARY
ncbi:MAG: ABC transporter ATP-binding protein [Leptolyngbyaceae cyanobacterium bins.59]|nr:ABC transporter ATP-binding protein [Leptolyngbyaceae cyanobacterium bins.59]